MTKLGSVIVFKPEVSKEEAAEALKRIAHLLDLPTKSYSFVRTGTHEFGGPKGSYRPKPFQINDLLNEFDPSMGGPVWYLP